ncbi:MAG: hypothetical protein QHH26_09035 [Armatimonadota bacterium]|nr:hypothetical protein [Armatimonadota bacterium]
MRLASTILVAILLGGFFPGHAQCAQLDGFVVPGTLDIKKVLSKPSILFARHACWPTEETIRAKKYDGNLDVEVADLLKILRRVLREDCIPSEAKVKQKRIGLVDLWNDGSDYVLLEYTTKSGIHIRIQDGKALYLLVSPPSRFHRELADVGAFVEQVASMVLNLPVFEGESAPKPTRSGISRDGSSAIGGLHYGPDAMSEWDWYSFMSWWSDGKQVLFKIYKLEKEEYVRRASMALVLPWEPESPRRFASRVQGAAAK